MRTSPIPTLPITRKLAGAGSLITCLILLMPAETQNAIANGDTRTLHLFHTHTQESIDITFKVNGQYDAGALQKLNWFLRDWRKDEPTKMDPRLFDVVWETYRESGSQEPIQIVSAYRSPETNAMLRRRSKAVAEYSQHMLGKAMDMHYTDVPMSKIREIGIKLQRGGVGYYPTAGSPFVHLDVGSVRAWPRMSYDQLARLFPDGKTVHLPPNGQPLARYEEARAEIEARGGASAPVMAQESGKGFFATLFGLGAEDEDAAVAAPPRQGPRSRVASYLENRRERQQQQQPTQVASVEPTTIPERRSATLDRAERDLPRGETFLAPSVSVVPTPAPRPGASAPPADARLTASVEARSDAPMPPRRPAGLFGDLFAQAPAPVPPSRPADLRSEPTRVARATDLPAVITTGNAPPAAGAQPAALLAFAPPQTPAASSPLPEPRPAANPRNLAALRPSLPPPAPRHELVAARLDKASFRTMTTPAPVARTAAPQRTKPSRAEIANVIFAQPTDVASRFSARPTDLSASSFNGPAVRPLPRRSDPIEALLTGRLN